MCVFLTCRNELWGVDFPGTVAKPGYMQLYNASARAVKAVDPSLKVGGPATAGLADLPAFVTACAAMGLPRPDFVSSHHCTCLPSPVACINAASVCSSRPGGCICSLFNSLRLLHIIGTGSLRLDIMNVCVCVCARARAAFRLHSDPSDGKSGPTPMQQACPSQQDWDPSCWNTQVKAAAAAVAPLPFLLTEYNVGCCLGYPQHDTSVRETVADVQTKRNTHQLI